MMVAAGGDEEATADIPLPRWALIPLVVLAVMIVAVLVAAGVLLWSSLTASGNKSREKAAQANLFLGAATALMTVTIAAATVWYARLTYSLVSHSDRSRRHSEAQVVFATEQVELARATLEASTRPLLADLPGGALREDRQRIRFPDSQTLWTDGERGADIIHSVTGTSIHFAVALRNIGVGPANIRRSSLNVTGAAFDGESNRVLVPSGETVWFSFAIPRVEAEDSLDDVLAWRGVVTVTVVYSAVGTDAEATTKVEIEISGPSVEQRRLRSLSFDPPRVSAPVAQKEAPAAAASTAKSGRLAT